MLKVAVGDIVHSQPIGSRDAFKGVVVAVYNGYFHVLDDACKLWHRTLRDLYFHDHSHVAVEHGLGGGTDNKINCLDRISTHLLIFSPLLD